MTPEKRADLIGYSLILCALVYVAPSVPAVMTLTQQAIQQFQEQYQEGHP